MSRLIKVVPPNIAVAEDSGVSSYRTQIVSLAVAQRPDGTAILTLRIGPEEADLLLEPDLRCHLASMLGEARP